MLCGKEKSCPEVAWDPIMGGMCRNVLIISSSARMEGNSDLLCEQFRLGALEAGHRVEKVRLAELEIGFCR